MGRKPMTPEQRAKMRSRILDAARDRFLEGGLDGLSMRGIASKVGVSSMTLYLYYESRTDIVRHIVAEGFGLLNEALQHASASGAAADRVKKFGDAYIKFALDNPRYYAAMFRYLSDHDAGGEDELIAGPSDGPVQTLKDIMAAAGLGDAEAEKRAAALWCSLHGLAMLAIGGQFAGKGVQPAEVSQTIAGDAARGLSA